MTGADFRAELVRNIEHLVALSRMESYGVHRLFAGFYVLTNRALLAVFDQVPDPTFCYLTIVRFNGIYDRLVAQPVLDDRSPTAPHWRRYGALGERLTMASTVGAHLRLISLATRAHTRYDLAEAFEQAITEYRELYGREPDLTAARSVLLGKPTSDAFYKATLQFNGQHLREQRGWRRAQLRLHAAIAWLTRPLWLTVFQSWRRAAWRDAMAAQGRS